MEVDLSARPRKYRDVFALRGNGHSRRLAGSFRVMSLRDPRPPLRWPRAASLALDNLSKVASGLAPCLPQKSLGHTSAYFRNRALSTQGPMQGGKLPGIPSGPHFDGPGTGGTGPPRNCQVRLKMASVRSTTPLPSASARRRE